MPNAKCAESVFTLPNSPYTEPTRRRDNSWSIIPFASTQGHLNDHQQPFHTGTPSKHLLGKQIIMQEFAQDVQPAPAAVLLTRRLEPELPFFLVRTLALQQPCHLVSECNLALCRLACHTYLEFMSYYFSVAWYH